MKIIYRYKNEYFILLYIFIILLISCGKKGINEVRGNNISSIIIKDIQILESMELLATPLGVDNNINEYFVCLSNPYDDFHNIGTLNNRNGDLKNTIKIKKGDMQSPGEINIPTYMERINNQYFIVDWFDKILCYDKSFKNLYTKMFGYFAERYFIDIFEMNNELYYVLGEKHIGNNETICSINIYTFDEKHRIKLYKKIYEFKNQSPLQNENKRVYGLLWASYWGFEKKGNVYFGSNLENKYYVYDIKNDSLKTVILSYLKGRIFDEKDAIIVQDKLYNSPLQLEKLKKKYNKEYVNITYNKMIYNYGIYDVGENNIGLGGDLNLEGKSFRLDIFNIKTGEYVESIWLPIGEGFARKISDGYRGCEENNYIDIDRGIHIWIKEQDNDLNTHLILNRFNIIRE